MDNKINIEIEYTQNGFIVKVGEISTGVFEASTMPIRVNTNKKVYHLTENLIMAESIQKLVEDYTRNVIRAMSEYEDYRVEELMDKKSKISK